VTGDIVFVLQLKDHPKFKRKYDDLYIEHTISLTEALCGFQFVLTHLDGRQLLIKSDPGGVIKPGMIPFWMCYFFGLLSLDLYCLYQSNALCSEQYIDTLLCLNRPPQSHK
jgi:hypothetical protein